VFDIDDYKQKIKEFFTNPKYNKLNKGERPRGYRNKSILYFLNNNGASTPDDDQANCFSKLSSICCLYAGHPEFLKIVQQCIHVQQSDKIALDYGLLAARLLEKILLSDDETIEIEKIMQELRKEDELFGKTLDKIDAINEDDSLRHLIKTLTVDDSSAILQLGPSCHLPSSFELATYFIRSANNPDDYQSRIRRALVSTGDNCSRILFIGACVGALNGVKAIPGEWKQKTIDFK